MLQAQEGPALQAGELQLQRLYCTGEEVPGRRGTAVFGQRAVFPRFAPHFVFVEWEQGATASPGAAAVPA